MYELTIYGKPVAQQRARLCRNGNVYNPNHKDKVRVRSELIYQIKPAELLEGPLTVNIIFYMPIPKSYTKKKLREIKEECCAHYIKPDIDNLIVFILNCMTQIIYIDDAQITSIYGQKLYSEEPRTIIKIGELKEKDGNS